MTEESQSSGEMWLLIMKKDLADDEGEIVFIF